MNVAPLRSALLSLAEAEAESLAADAAAKAAREISAAEADVQAQIERARAEGEAAAAREAARIVGRARSEGRALVLSAQREVYEELRRRTFAAVGRLREDPAYGRLLDRLQVVARGRLGRETSLDVDPPAVGGVRASSGPRRIDLSLPALAERCLAGLGPDVERLWR